MNTGKYIFAQLIEFLPQRIFDRIVMKYEGNKYVKHFTCWNQLLVMMFGQLSNRDSLRDLTNTVSAHTNKAYHLGFGKNVTRSNLAKVNERREPWASGPSRKKAGIHTDASLLSFFLSAVVILAFLSRFCSHRDSRGR